ncbi:TPR repeat-containing protein [Cryptosporidium andersoni]|uniref:peptidylprolyl isomerase n=1 Tax=Cryptosporidium andersoni TaxID=117008 RepID=A0A1J4MTK3_9CRYT|nr:TPR repeat-containing protein [Cryptosporidium andersoni]
MTTMSQNLDIDSILESDKEDDIGDIKLDESIEREEDYPPNAKDQGNEAYSLGEFNKAIELWLRAYRSCCYILDKKIYETQPDKLEDVQCMKLQIENNLAMGYLKLKDYKTAIKYADSVLSSEHKNIKALYRKAEALFYTLEYKLCIETLEFALKIEPENTALKKLHYYALKELSKYQTKSRKMSKAIIKNISGNSDECIRKSTRLFNCQLFISIYEYIKAFNCRIMSKICPTRLKPKIN